MSNNNIKNLKKSSSTENISNQIDSLNIEQIRDVPTKRRHRRRVPDYPGYIPGQPQKKISRSASESEEFKEPVISKDVIMTNLPQPPQEGNYGEPIPILVNCFKVKLHTENVSMYSIEFVPDLPVDSKIFKQGLIYKHSAKLKELFSVYIFHNDILWSCNYLPDDIEIPDKENGLRIKYIRSINMRDAPYEEFSYIVHSLLSISTKRTNLVKIGRSFYDKNSLKDDRYYLKNDAIRLFRGYSLNIDQSSKGLFLTSDISHRVISVTDIATLLDSWDENLKRTPKDTPRGTPRGISRGTSRGNSTSRGKSDPRESYGINSGNDGLPRINTPAIIARAEEEIIGRSVLTNYRMRNWRIDEIDWNLNIDSKFEWRKKSGEKKMISYRDYYMDNYRLKLTNERKGMLVNIRKVRSQTRLDKGPDRFVIPPEACYLTGLSKKMKSDFGLMKRIRDVVTLTPQKRLEGIKNMVNLMSKNFDSSASSEGVEKKLTSEEENLRIHIDPRIMSFTARIMKEPSLRIKTNNRPQNIRAKDLMRQWTRAGCINPSPHNIDRWIVFHEVRYHQQANALVSELMRTASRFQMMKKPLDIIEVNVNPRARNVFDVWKSEIEYIMGRVSSLQLIVVLLPNHYKSDQVYSAVKSATLMHSKKLLPTQCIKASRFERRASRSLPSVLSSTHKQILSKRGNIPWIVNFETLGGRFDPFKTKTMLCGIDVNHDLKRNQSTAGFCVSGDSRFARYDTYVSIGPCGRENINGAEKCMVKSLVNFHQDNGVLPEHIILYRDGVSNSELTKIANTEVKSFRESFKHREIVKRANGNYEPKFTFIVVQKRVSLRIFNTRGYSGEPGTIVDSSITSSRFWDFYMLSTRAPPGKTARPTRYIVVYDDFGLENDEIQKFTHQLCHTYYNFPGPIRVPGPVMISHNVSKLYGTIVAGKHETQLFTPKCKGKAYYL